MVEWKKLGEVCKVHTGSQLNRADMLDEGKYPVVNGGREFSGYTDTFNERANNITISQGGESAGYVNWISDDFWAGAHCYVVEESKFFDKRFLYHTLKNKERDIQTSKQGAGIPGLNRDTLYKLLIPIPPLFEQQRIVEELDVFTSSIENLREQIAQRRKQYEYYRDQLFDLEGKEGIEMKPLGEISINLDYKRKPITSSKRQAGDYPYYGASGIVDYVEGYIFDGDYLLISEDGANLVARTYPIAFSINGKNWVNNHAHVLEFKEKATQKFVEIYLNMIDLTPWINGAAQPKLNQANLNLIEIPIPPLSEQQRIVSILDTFEASIQNLEAQLKQREKQYEYYRNKLLTF